MESGHVPKRPIAWSLLAVGIYHIIWEFLAVACHCKSYHVGCKFGICGEECGPVHVLKKPIVGSWLAFGVYPTSWEMWIGACKFKYPHKSGDYTS